MDYYEELGVGRSASLAEIRQAYKSLVRVLHPDQQQEESLRRLSELQLRRLNHMLQVLSDPLQRRQYDLSLDRLFPARMQPDLPQTFAPPELRGVRLRLHLKPGVLVWMLIAAIAIGTGIFWMRSPEPVYSEPVRVSEPKPVHEQAEAAAVPVQRVETPPASEPSYPDGRRVAEKPREHAGLVPRSSVPTPHYAEQPLLPIPTTNSSAPTTEIKHVNEPAPSTLAVSAPPVQPVEPLPGPSTAIPKTREYSMSGKWLYVPRHDETKKGMYPPEYIEMQIRGNAGLLTGKYHAKYKVNDRPISSEVNFQFEGKPSGAIAVLPWSSSNGSRGELRLKRISDDSLEVNWITTIFGNGNTLASGTAVLYRSDPP